MTITFEKYEGTGNDFVIIDDGPAVFDGGNNVLIRKLCDRHFGIGADGLILIRKKEGYDYEMLYFNADGSPGSMCGNGSRCAAAFAVTKGLAGEEAHFLAFDGPHRAFISEVKGERNAWMVKLSMADIASVQQGGDHCFLDTGSPHHVQFVENISQVDVAGLGRTIRSNRRYAPGGTNVDFVQADGERLLVRTYERGVENETLCCGTGVTASVISAALTGRIKGKACEVQAAGGPVTVYYKKGPDGRFTDIWLEGIVRKVFTGEAEAAP